MFTSKRHYQVINFDADTRLASNESGSQLYVVGGDQSLDLAALGVKGHEAKKDLAKVGPVYSVTYVTAKHHLGKADQQPGPYEHVFGKKVKGKRAGEPTLSYDTMNQEVELVGGGYHIDVDIEGKYSAGIRD